MKTTPSPAVEWPPGGAISSTRSASQGKASTDFGALLDTQARTATAEGPKKHKSPERTEARQAKPARDHEPREPRVQQEQPQPKPVDAPRSEPKPAAHGEQQGAEGEQAQGDGPTVEAAPVANEPVVEFVPAPVIAEVAKPQAANEPVVAATAPVAPQAQAATEPAALQAVAQQQQQPATTPAATAVPGDAQVAVDANAKQQPQAAQQAVLADEQPADAPVETAPTRVDKPAQPQGQQQAQTGQQPSGDQPRQQQGDQRPADQPRVATTEQPVQQRAAAAPEARADRAQAQPVQQQAQSPTAVNAPTPSTFNATRTEAATRAVPLSQAADAVENVIRLGSQRGVTHARMSLKPADLGGIEIRLQQTASGLTASVVADGAEAAQMLQQAGADLRQKLEAQGIQLQSLDITYAGDEQRDARSAAAQTGDGERRSSTNDSSSATDGGELTPTEEISVKETLELPDGVLVDVLA